jgi:hypothetical protein
MLFSDCYRQVNNTELGTFVRSPLSNVHFSCQSFSLIRLSHSHIWNYDECSPAVLSKSQRVQMIFSPCRCCVLLKDFVDMLKIRSPINPKSKRTKKILHSSNSCLFVTTIKAKEIWKNFMKQTKISSKNCTYNAHIRIHTYDQQSRGHISLR